MAGAADRARLRWVAKGYKRGIQIPQARCTATPPQRSIHT
jgi:hypothetical protein